MAQASKDRVGRRARTVYSITRKGRRALAAWLHEPGAGPVIEFEQLLKVFFCDNGTKADALASLDAAMEWSRSNSEYTASIGRQYVETSGPFPERSAQRNVSVRFLIDFYPLVGDWARWARGVVERWPENPRQATVSDELVLENQRRAEAAATWPLDHQPHTR